MNKKCRIFIKVGDWFYNQFKPLMKIFKKIGSWFI